MPYYKIMVTYQIIFERDEKMKKLTSLFIAFTIIIGQVFMFPVSAQLTDAELSALLNISTLENGDSFVEGSNILLGVESGLSHVIHINFYANGNKIPGSLTDGENENLVWSGPKSGIYKIYAEAIYLDSKKDTLSSTKSSEIEVTISEGIASGNFTATPSIPNGQANVANELEKYRVNFNQKLKNPDTAAAAIKLKKGENEINVTKSAGFDYVDLIPVSPLEYGSYTVELAGNAILNTADTALAATTFTFSTKNAFNVNATPIPSVVYPIAGSKLKFGDTRIAIQTISTEGIQKVDFYKSTGETSVLLGSVTESILGDEYQLDVALEKGDYTVYATVTYETSTKGTETSTISSAPVSFTVDDDLLVSTPMDVTITGLENGDRYVINSGINKKVSVTENIDEGASAALTKVEFKIDGTSVLVDETAPFEYTLPTDIESENVGEKTLSIIGYNASGLSSYVNNITYESVFGQISSQNTNTFEDSTMVIEQRTSGNGTTIVEAGGSIAQSDALESSAFKVTGPVKVEGQSYAITNYTLHENTSATYDYDIKGLNNSSRIAYFGFDVYKEGKGNLLSIMLRDIFLNINYVTMFTDRHDTPVMSNGKHRIEFMIDFANKRYETYLDGELLKRGTLGTRIDKPIEVQNQAVIEFQQQTWGAPVTYWYDNATYKTFTAVAGSELVERAVLGISDGENIIINDETAPRKIAVIDASAVNTIGPVLAGNSTLPEPELTDPTNVAKAEFKLDNQIVHTATTAPFTYDMPVGEVGPHTLTVTVTDIFDRVEEFIYNFNNVYGGSIGGFEEDFENISTDIYYDNNNVTGAFGDHIYTFGLAYKPTETSPTNGAGTYRTVVEIPNNGKWLKVWGNALSIGLIDNETTKTITATENHQVVFAEFDTYMVGGTKRLHFNVRRSMQNGNGQALMTRENNVTPNTNVTPLPTTATANDPNHADFTALEPSVLDHYKIKLDFTINEYTIYVNDFEYYRGALNDTLGYTNQMCFLLPIADFSKKGMYFDNFSVRCYNLTGSPANANEIDESTEGTETSDEPLELVEEVVEPAEEPAESIETSELVDEPADVAEKSTESNGESNNPVESLMTTAEKKDETDVEDIIE